jgi:hypothetical protein
MDFFLLENGILFRDNMIRRKLGFGSEAAWEEIQDCVPEVIADQQFSWQITSAPPFMYWMTNWGASWQDSFLCSSLMIRD